MESQRSSGDGNNEVETNCFDELMDTNDTGLDSYFEEGEIQSSDDEHDTRDYAERTSVSRVFLKSSSKRLPEEKSAMASIELFGNDEEMKKLRRAKRFALVTKNENSSVDQNEEFCSLYRDLGIDKENERHYRFNAIHMRGVQDMTTDDILDYFEIYSPLNIEWVSDVSCNVVWSDDISAARALLGLSKRIKNLDKIHSNDEQYQKYGTNDLTSDKGVDARDIKVAIPPGFWRIGTPDTKCQFPLLRYATKSDKKQKPTEKIDEHSEYSGLLSHSKRREMNQSRQNHSWNKTCDQNVTSRVKKSNPWSDLAFEWGKTDKVEKVNYPPPPEYNHRTRSPPPTPLDVPDLRLTLRNKKEKHKRYYAEINDDHEDYKEEETEVRSKVPRMRMYADEEEEKLGKIRLNSGVIRKPVEDLRTKINRKKNRKRLNLRIERQQTYDVASNESSISNDEYESYRDLRESIRQNKTRYKHERSDRQRYESEEDENDEDDISDDLYLKNSGQRSPLQIEIENDEYYERRSNKR